MLTTIDKYGRQKTVSLADVNNAVGVLSPLHGGTGLDALGSAGQLLQVNGAGDALEYVTDLALPGTLRAPNIYPAPSSGLTRGIHLNDDGNIYMGTDVVSNFLTRGLHLFQGNADGYILEVSSSDVGHSAPDVDPRVFGTLSKFVAVQGGLNINGYSQGSLGINIGAGVGLEATGLATNASATFTFRGRLVTGGAYTSLASNANVIRAMNSTTALWILRGDGLTWQTGGAIVGGDTLIGDSAGTPSARLHAKGSVAATPVIIGQGAASQSANLLQLLTNASAIQFAIGPAGSIRTNQTAAATSLGSVVRRLPIYDASGTLLGQIPIYDAIS